MNVDIEKMINHMTPTQSVNLLMRFLEAYERIHSYIGPERQLTCGNTQIIIERVYEQLIPGYFTSDWRITVNGRVIDHLCWDEMLGTIAAGTLTGRMLYGGVPQDSYEDRERIRNIRTRLGPLLDFPEGETSRHMIQWENVGD